MNPLDLEKQKQEEGIVDDSDVAPPMPCGDGCPGCETCTVDPADDTPPETEQPAMVVDEDGPEIQGDSPMQAGAQTVKDNPELIKGLQAAKDEAETKQMPPEDDPQLQEEVILQGIAIELTSTGDVKRNFYGDSQNVTLMLGLAKIMQMEVETRQKLQRGFMPSAELTAMSGLAMAMQNIGSVLVQVQGLLGTMNETMKAGFDESGPVESTVDAEPQQE